MEKNEGSRAQGKDGGNMKISPALRRTAGLLLVVFLLLIFCGSGHSCHHPECPVCLLTAAFRLSMGLAALALGFVFSPGLGRRILEVCAKAKGGASSLVALKVKLSD